MVAINPVDTNGYWMVNSIHLPVPGHKMKVEHDNVVGSESGRTEDGINHIDWVRRDVRKLYLTWGAMTKEELDIIVNNMQGQEFTFTFRDRGVTRTMSAYSGKCSYELVTHDYMGLGIELYANISINVVEM